MIATRRITALIVAMATVAAIAAPPVRVSASPEELGYQPEAAVAWAAEHWADDGPHCDWFVKDALRAGNIAVHIENVAGLEGEHAPAVLPSDVGPLRQGLLDLGYGTEVQVNTDPYYAKAEDNPDVAAGDILFWHCNICGVYKHVAVIGGVNEAGNLYYYAHNPAADRGVGIGAYHCPGGHDEQDTTIWGRMPTIMSTYFVSGRLSRRTPMRCMPPAPWRGAAPSSITASARGLAYAPSAIRQSAIYPC